VNCPTDATPLWTSGPSRHDYKCPRCHTNWTIVPQPEGFTFNRAAPFAQLVLDIDHIYHPHKQRRRHESSPAGRPRT
jgi:hypothetical protein